jgi:hypothetical protein
VVFSFCPPKQTFQKDILDKKEKEKNSTKLLMVKRCELNIVFVGVVSLTNIRGSKLACLDQA